MVKYVNKLLILTLIICLFSSINVLALNKCESERLKELKNKASKIELDYGYTMKIDDYNYVEPVEYAAFYLNILNHDKELIYTYRYEKGEILLDEGQTRVDDIIAGSRITVYIYALTTDECSNKLLGQKTIFIPYYNEFSKREECIEYPEFEYCQEYTNSSKKMEESEFLEKLEQYKTKKEESKNSVVNYVTENKGFMVPLFIGIVLFSSIIFIILIKTKKREDII